jgi:hypothetical protein
VAELRVVVTFESDGKRPSVSCNMCWKSRPPRRSRTAVQQLRQANEHMMVQYSRALAHVYTRVWIAASTDAALHLPHPRSRRDVEQAILGATLRAFAMRRYRFRLYRRGGPSTTVLEGKPLMRATPIDPGDSERQAEHRGGEQMSDDSRAMDDERLALIFRRRSGTQVPA